MSKSTSWKSFLRYFLCISAASNANNYFIDKIDLSLLYKESLLFEIEVGEEYSENELVSKHQ